MSFRRTSALMATLAFALIGTSAAWAQEARGTISGRITDPTGAVVPAVMVQVTNKAMGTKFNAQTNESGVYSATFLLPGAYQVTAEVAGFKKSLRDNIELRVNDALEVNLQLEVGAADQSITVSAETPLLNTTNASIGTVVDTRRVAELPTAHGNPMQLIGLATGVGFTGDMRLDRPFEPTHIVGYTMDGTRGNRSDVMIDGVPATATANAGQVIASYVPPPDIVQEFKVQTATFDASFGQTEGGVTNISLKSGTNDFHGTAYWTKMVPELFANDFFANATRTPRPDFYYDRWGGSFGGPVRLPKIYDGRNKTFFMFGHEGILEGRPRNNGTATVPTEKFKQGDFSDLLKINSSYQIYNPFTRRAAAGGRFQMDPFPNNIIPANLINPVAKAALQYFPTPRSTGNADFTNNYQRPELIEQADYKTNSLRVDHVFTDKHRIYVRGSWYDRTSSYNNFFDNLATGEYFQFISRAAVFDDVYTLNPTTVLNVRYGYNRFIRVTNANAEQHGFDLTSLGFPAAYANAISPDIRRFPRFDIAGYQGTGIGGEYRPNDTHSINATINKSIGGHYIKSGTEFRSYRETDVFFGNDMTGRFNFDGSWVRGPQDNSPGSPNNIGQSFAQFLLGIPTASNSLVARNASYAEQSTSWGFFVHDDWKATSKLTLNLGVRWEFETPLTERFNRTVRGFDPNAAMPFAAAAQARYAANPTPEVAASAFRIAGGLTFAGVNGQPRGTYNTPKTNLMPRFGLAYKLTQSTVLRGGYGIYYGFLGQRRGDVIQTGFSRNTNLIPSIDNGLTFQSTLSNPFPDGILEPVGSAQGPLTFVGQSVTFFNENPIPPYMQRWQLGLQHQFRGGWVLETSYVGNRGTHQEMSYNLNATPLQYLSTSPERDNTRNNYLSQNVPNPFVGLLPAGASSTFTNANIARDRLLRPYPQFDAINNSRFDGYSWYHSLQVTGEKRFSKGYTLSANYTWSKFMQANELLNALDVRPTEAISDVDRPHRLTVSGIWELPFGKGRAFAGGMNRVGNALVAGWQFSGIYSYQSGAPFGFGNVIFRGDVKNIALPASERSVARWFNTDAGFEKNANNQLVNNVRTFPLRFSGLRGEAINNYDFSLFKNNKIGEKFTAQFRGDFLNAFNHPLFTLPNTNPTQVQFGTIQASTQSNYPRRIQLTLKLIF
ncbi:MAG: carboxypeptidase-like regulatory domain-containing protein [Bryobacteraceae bacterium]|nr:carboxypeptidase-like regulatory domain-containing protein [Bryobacteraceae bacterium]